MNTISVDGVTTETYKASRTVIVSGNLLETVSGTYNLTVESDNNETYNSLRNITISGDLSETITGEYNLRLLSSNNSSIKSNGSITLETNTDSKDILLTREYPSGKLHNSFKLFPCFETTNA